MKQGAFVCLLAAHCLAQSASLSGVVRTRTPGDLSHLVVRLETGNPGNTEQAMVGVGGDFRFFHVALGTYSLVVADEMGNEITREPINVQQSNPEVRVQLPDPSPAGKPGGTISVAQLRHTPPLRAFQAAVKAERLSAARDYSGAAAQLEKAVALDPAFAEAHSNLGSQYVRLGQPSRAIAEFERAIALDPASAMTQANFSLVLAQVGRTADAVRWSRHALQIDSTNPVGNYVLGFILAKGGQGPVRAEGIRHLQLAARTLPAAATALDEVQAASVTPVTGESTGVGAH